MDMETFVNKMMLNERNKKIRSGKKKDQELRNYSAQRCFERNTGKVDTWKRRYVNMDR